MCRYVPSYTGFVLGDDVEYHRFRGYVEHDSVPKYFYNKIGTFKKIIIKRNWYVKQSIRRTVRYSRIIIRGFNVKRRCFCIAVTMGTDL
jgi:hypothetical protein